MIKLSSLTHKEYAKYFYAIRNTQLIRYVLTTFDENDHELGSLTLPHDSSLISGQRDIDTSDSSSPTRSLTIDFVDQHSEIALHPNDPAEAGIFLNRFIEVRRGVYVGHLQRWVDVPVFYGPITKFTRDQEQSHIEAKGKELLFLTPHLMWTVKSFKKGEKITDVIKAIMREKGERRFDIPEIDQPLPKHLSVSRHQEPWPVLQRLAKSLNRQLYYDGRGVAKLRQFPANPVYTFHDGEQGTLIGRPSFSFDHETVRNLVEVLGPKPSGKKQHRIRAVARLPEDNILSPESLAWNGQPRFLVESIDINAPSPSSKSDSAKKKASNQEALIHRQKYADDLSKRRLRELSMDELTVTADMVPMGDLEEFDIIGLEWEGDHFEARLKQSTLPFTDENMTIGYLKRVSIHHRMRRRRPGRNP
jgi:hypothetical protein